MNWGKGIVTGMIVFMLFILAMCVRMFLAPEDEYDHQYYEKGLNFDADYKRERQVVIDGATPQIAQQNKNIALKFIGPAKGTVQFVRPSSQAADKTFSIGSDSKGNVLIDGNTLQPGKWQLVLSWLSNGKAYLYRQEIYFK